MHRQVKVTKELKTILSLIEMPVYSYYYRGKLGKRETSAHLTVEDCLDLAVHCYEGKHPLRSDLHAEYALAIEWIEAALE